MTDSVLVEQDFDITITQDEPDVMVIEDDLVTIVGVPEQGPPGPAGTPGAPGTPGNTVMYGAGPPNSAMGRDGDWYIDTNTHNMYGPKSSGAWPVTYTSLIGPQGPAGVNGNTILYGSGAPANTLGVDGNFYIDTSAHMLYEGRRRLAGRHFADWSAGTARHSRHTGRQRSTRLAVV